MYRLVRTRERYLSYVECSKGRDENVLVMYDEIDER